MKTGKVVFWLFVVSAFLVAMFLPEGKKEVAITGHMAPITPELEKKFQVFRDFEKRRMEARNFVFDVASAVSRTFRSAERTITDAFTNSDSEYWQDYVRDHGWDKAYPKVLAKYGKSIKASAKQHGVDHEVLTAIIAKESSGNPKAVNVNTNGTVDLGLGQINFPGTANVLLPGVTKEELFDPELNIHLSAKRLALAKEGTSSDAEAIMAYHFGEVGARKRIAESGKTAELSDDWLLVNAIIKLGKSS